MTPEQEQYIQDLTTAGNQRPRIIAKCQELWPGTTAETWTSRINKVRASTPAGVWALCVRCGQSFEARGDQHTCTKCEFEALLWPE